MEYLNEKEERIGEFLVEMEILSREQVCEILRRRAAEEQKENKNKESYEIRG